MSHKKVHQADWVKLRKGNDWGHVYYALEPHVRGMANRDRGMNVAQAAVLPAWVRWPDGTITENELRAVSQTDQVPDHGHTYEATSQRLYVVSGHRGIETLIGIEEVEVDRAWAAQLGAK